MSHKYDEVRLTHGAAVFDDFVRVFQTVTWVRAREWISVAKCIRDLLAKVRHTALDNWANLVFVRWSCFTSQQRAKLLAKRLQLVDFLIDFLQVGAR